MNSLFAKILLWFCCTVAITVVGSAFISALNVIGETAAPYIQAARSHAIGEIVERRSAGAARDLESPRGWCRGHDQL